MGWRFFLDSGVQNFYFLSVFSVFLPILRVMEQELSDRQREILRLVVCNFIATASPVASRYLSRHHELSLSAATIRNELADLEEMGYVTHPHTSAGRIPTDKGYRFFIDWLMNPERLSEREIGDIRITLEGAAEPDSIFHIAAKLVGSISHQLSVVSSPHLQTSVLDHIDLIPLSSNRLFVLLAIRAGIVRTITMEVTTEISSEKLSIVARMLTERLSGLTLQTIRDTFVERVKDFQDEQTGLISLFMKTKDRIFDDSKEREKLHIGGTQSLIEQPEYGNPENVRKIIQLINDEVALVNALEKGGGDARQEGVSITIGHEHGEEALKNYSIIVATYKVGEGIGSIGVIGPTRMNYAKVIPLVHHIAAEVSASLK